MGTTFNIKLKAESHLQPVKDVCTSPQDNLPLSSFQPSSAWLSGEEERGRRYLGEKAMKSSGIVQGIWKLTHTPGMKETLRKDQRRP